MRHWTPRAMRVAPQLDRGFFPPTIDNKTALLINPFYPKDPHASFGKHVLTPSLALTSVAGSTPADWQVAYWDENLLQGAAPNVPFPQKWTMKAVCCTRTGIITIHPMSYSAPNE